MWMATFPTFATSAVGCIQILTKFHPLPLQNSLPLEFLMLKRYLEVSAFHLVSLSKAFYNFVCSAHATRLNRQIYLIKCKQETKIEMF
jgi:hypothetical protein